MEVFCGFFLRIILQKSCPSFLAWDGLVYIWLCLLVDDLFQFQSQCVVVFSSDLQTIYLLTLFLFFRYLSCLCQGEAPPDLNPESSIRVRKLFSTLCKTLNQLGLEKETKYLESFRGPHSVYPNNRNWDQTSDSAANMIKLSSLPGMNPLQLHPAMFTRNNNNSEKD